MKDKIELGDKVQCKYSGFTGIAVAKQEFINKCVQFTVIPKHSKSKQFIPPEEITMDEQSLIIIKKKKPDFEPEEVEEPPGGPNRKDVRQRGF